ncbi:hypothetical protein K504DRAFT_450934 [Pleomassaria siparia CBS 279.74]|uniref:Uncharacterized protein n=1 Tax=Pleomassaria siparia CBS 279.74 TaxID=1314801 RepID=A0A6G1JUH3_9PLEO|nr:hypothetical protein K504DRAFT_450934 [Pleomassaria siparia CBS 279.74]
MSPATPSPTLLDPHQQILGFGDATMPLTDRDPNASGRTSRASNMSAGSRGLPSKGAPAGRNASDLLSNAPGIMSMLRTSTELGDMGSFAFDSSYTSNMPRGPGRRGGASSRLSTCSSQSNTSRRASSTHHQQWPSTSSGPSRSTTRDHNMPLYMPDTLSPTTMNIQGSSPLFPRSRSRDEHRSLSMTNTSQPTFRLSSNRSLASLRPHEHAQRPRSPYHYPTRLRRPGYRPSSPALSDITGTHMRRPHGSSGGPGHAGHTGHHKLRHPSDVSVYRDERAFGREEKPFVHKDRRFARNQSPAFMRNPHSDIPPVPPLPPHLHHMVVDRARMRHMAAKGSVSSGSTNQRSDSDAPSSDATPPTPRGRSMEMLVGPTGAHMMMGSMAGVMKEEVPAGPLYYDYSEQFEREQFIEPESDALNTGFVHHFKTIVEERGTGEQTPDKADNSVVREVVELLEPEAAAVAELPASPVSRRITRDMILAALEPSSTTESRTSMENHESEETDQKATEDRVEAAGQSRANPAASIPQPTETHHRRFSNLSQAGSSIMESSTLDFAARYSIPMVDGTGSRTPTRAGSLTEDGMSDLIDGYQHTTETNVEEDVAVEEEGTDDEPPGRKSSHAPKSSDEQSFKSCTVLADFPDKDSDAKSCKTFNNSNAKSLEACEDLPGLSFKDSDARSFKSCRDVSTPGRAVSLPPPKLPSSNLANSEPRVKRPVSEMTLPLPSPPATVRKQRPVPSRETSFNQAHARLSANSKLGSKHGGSTVNSISSSIECLPGMPPVVPPRESSSSKEAQRSQAVADFLMRLSRSRRFSKSHSALGKKQAQEEEVGNPEDNVEVVGSDANPRQQGVADENCVPNQRSDPVMTPAKALAKDGAVPGDHVPSAGSLDVPSKEGFHSKEITPAKADTLRALAVHQYSMSTPSTNNPEPSSIYSPDDISSPSSSSHKARVQSSPMAFAKSPEPGRRDSQTTTHLVWHGRKSSNVPSRNSMELRSGQGNGQDETTTDLRLSAYRYPPQHCLPDLKEESHEDSSLNTSASNLKNSNFKFPFGAQPGVRMSGDEGFLSGRNPSRNPSTMSYQRSSLGQTRGLPSMNFSRMDLFEKLNEALDIRSSRSLDGVPDDVHDVAKSSPTRPSAGEIREKYRSFLAGLDELEKSGDASKVAAIMKLAPQRPYSSAHLMAEIEKLTIPSVGGLTRRLSELIPSLKEYYKLGEMGEFVAEEVIMEHALEEIHEVGGPAPKRSSARLRPMPGSPNMVVIDDALYDELTCKENGEESLDSKSENDTPQKGVVVTGKGGSPADARPRDSTPLAELEAPTPALLRTRSLSPSLGHDNLRPSLESHLSTRRSLHSLGMSTPTATTTDTRPWNSDKNYPWATNVPEIDISLPSPSSIKPSPVPVHRASRLQQHLSQEDFAIMSIPAAPTPLHSVDKINFVDEGTSFLTRQQREACRGLEARHALDSKNQHRNIFCKHPTKPQRDGFDASGNATRPLRLRDSDQSHDAGERYPFSALTPPSNLLLPGLPSCTFTNGSSDEEEFTAPKKNRLFRIRGRLARNANNTPVVGIQLISAHDVKNSLTPVESVHEGTMGNPNRQTFTGAEGMSKSAYQRKAFVEYVKKMVTKGSEAIRNLTGRKRMSKRRSQFPSNVEDLVIYDAHGRRYAPLSGTRGVHLWTGV